MPIIQHEISHWQHSLQSHLRRKRKLISLRHAIQMLISMNTKIQRRGSAIRLQQLKTQIRRRRHRPDVILRSHSLVLQRQHSADKQIETRQGLSRHSARRIAVDEVLLGDQLVVCVQRPVIVDDLLPFEEVTTHGLQPVALLSLVDERYQVVRMFQGEE